MIDWLGRKWTVPMALAVIPLGGCGDDENPDAGTETQAPTTGGESSGSADDDGATQSTGSDTASTSEAAGSDSGDVTGATQGSESGSSSGSSDSGDGTGGETGEALPCASILDEAECGAEMYCAWSPPGYCFTNCNEIPDLATCVAQLECIWVGDESCEFGGV